jgi:hypothetical protein
MVHFIRTEQGKTIIECTVSASDLSAAVNLLEYSKELLTALNKPQFIADFTQLNEIRGIYWGSNPDSGENIDRFVETAFKSIATKYRYEYITD